MLGRIAMALTVLGSACAANASSCEFSAERSLTLDAAGVSEFRLSARAGDLEIIGDASAQRIDVSGKACASSQALLDQILLEEGSAGATRSVDVLMPDSDGGWWSSYARMDVVVRLPARLQLSVDDSSGHIEIEQLASVDLRDSSGDIRIRSIAGAVKIRDSSGDIDVREIVGDVVVSNDSSGDIRIEQVQGSARVEVDSSGSILLREIERDAFVGRDSSGEIVMERINGNAEVQSDGSGSIRASEVRGDFRVGKDGGGRISHSGIGGEVSIPAH